MEAQNVKFVSTGAQSAELPTDMVEKLQEVLNRVFLASEDAVLPYEQMLMAFLDSFYNLIQLTDKEFLEVLD